VCGTKSIEEGRAEGLREQRRTPLCHAELHYHLGISMGMVKE